MYPWYRDNHISVGQYYGPVVTSTIKTENGYNSANNINNDCLLADSALAQSKKNSGAFAWSNEISVNTTTNNNNDTNTNNNNHNSSNNNISSNSESRAENPSQTHRDSTSRSSPDQHIISSSTPSTTTTTAATTINCLPSGDHNSMPVPGAVGQGQNPTQGLVHWMSAVMAEHMTSNSHHDPAVGMHYMWNGVDQCGQHTKDIDTYGGWSASARNHMSMKQGYEAKMSSIDHHNNIQKGHMIDDGRMDHHAIQGGAQMTPASIYGAAAGALRSGSSNSSSPGGIHGGVHHGHHGPGSALLVVPQPINATKMGAGLTNGTGRKYQCKMCPQKHSNSTSKKKIFSSKADLQLHTQIHMREAKPYKCSQCSKAFANSSYLSQHTRIHLGIKPYRCEICQRKFTQLSHLQQHIRTHTGDKPYKCRHPGCQKAFSQLSNLQSHSRCHQTDKPYKCNSCYKCFSDEPSLLEHIPKHKESKHLKTHICQYCGKSYTQETYLTKHMQKHAERTDKRPPIGMSTGGNRNVPANSQLPGMTGDHPYWPKVSPDSAANITDVMQHQQHHQTHTDFTIQHQNGHAELQPHHRGLLEHQQRGEENGEDLVVSRQNSANVQNHNGQNLSLPPSSTPMSSAGSYDVITKTTTNSAFTPINTMPPHLNTLGHHHQLARQPYLYDAISFPNKNMPQNTGNTFPNQLISLHQIRNYAHQPSGLMAGEHLLGVSVGVGGKDKG